MAQKRLKNTDIDRKRNVCLTCRLKASMNRSKYINVKKREVAAELFWMLHCCPN